MKILYIHQYFKTREGTGSTRSYEFAKYLVKKGHSVTMLTGDSRLPSMSPIKRGKHLTKYKVDGITVIAIKNKYSNSMGFLKRVISFLNFMILSSLVALRLKNYDIVYATSTPLTVAVPALLIRYIKKIPYVFEVRDLWPEAPIQVGAIKSPVLIKCLKLLERKTYMKANHIVALSPGMEKGVIETGVERSKVSTVPNCSDLDLFGSRKDKPEHLLNKYHLHKKFIVVHGGSMGVANGLDYVIKAAIELEVNKKDHGIVFMLTGEGKTKPRLESMCKEYNLTNVIFTGEVPRKVMPEILAVSDITITSFQNIPILATNSPNKFFDSLAAGKPIIVNSNGWTKDIVEKYNAGFYVNPERPIELAELLINIKNQQELLDTMGQNAKKLAKQKFERSKLAKQVEEILVNAVS